MQKSENNVVSNKMDCLASIVLIVTMAIIIYCHHDEAIYAINKLAIISHAINTGEIIIHPGL